MIDKRPLSLLQLFDILLFYLSYFCMCGAHEYAFLMYVLKHLCLYFRCFLECAHTISFINFEKILRNYSNFCCFFFFLFFIFLVQRNSRFHNLLLVFYLSFVISSNQLTFSWYSGTLLCLYWIPVCEYALLSRAAHAALRNFAILFGLSRSSQTKQLLHTGAVVI